MSSEKEYSQHSITDNLFKTLYIPFELKVKQRWLKN